MSLISLKTDAIKHSCGECVLCCVYPEISDPLIGDKPFGTVCKNCTGNSCAIYTTRPQVCRNFECLWRFGLVKTSPLESKVVWGMDWDEKNQEVIVFAQCEDAGAFVSSIPLLMESNRFLSSDINGKRVGSVVVRSSSLVAELRRLDDFKVGLSLCQVLNGIPQTQVVKSEVFMQRQTSENL